MRVMRMLMAGAIASSLLVASPAFAAAGTGWLEASRAAGELTGESGPDVAVSLPVGSGSGEIGIESGEEQPTWGPASFDVDDEGRFWIVDGVNSRLVVVGAGGAHLRDIPFREPVAGALDVDVIDERVFLLDLVSQPSAVREIDQLGSVVSSWEIPDEYVALGVSGVRVENGGSGVDIALEVAGSWEVPLARGGRPSTPKRIPVRLRGNHAELPVQARGEYAIGCTDTRMRFSVEKDWSDWKHASLTTYDRGLEIGKVTLESDAELGTVRFLGCDSTDSTYLFVERMLDGGSRTKAYVKVFDRSGTPARQARLPIEEIDAFPERLARVTDAGDVFALVPSKSRIEIHRLVLAENVSAALPTSGEESTQNASAAGEERDDEGIIARALNFASGLLAPEEAYAIWTRLDANDRAWDYVGNSWYCSGANYSRSCGDYRPRYITASGKTYRSVPYCWGGWDTVGGFNQDMKDGLDAGDINCTGGKRSCTSGVDCSGFVSRCWGLGAKRSTSTLPAVAYRVNKNAMQLADAYIRPGVHTMLFRYYGSSGSAQVFESTTSHQYDRVVSHARTESELSSYGAYRYQNW